MLWIGLPHTSAKNRGAPVALVWNLALILGALTTWWIFWRFNDVAWTPIGFVWVVAAPGLNYLQAAVLLTDNPRQVASWESHYFEVRRRFFGVTMAWALHIALLPWIVGTLAWFTPAPGHMGAIVTFLVSLVGLLSRSRRVHLALASILIVITVLFLLFTPSQVEAAA